MLERLFSSKTRVKLLRLFLANDSESYFLEDVCKKTGLNSNIVKKELENLEKLNLINEGKSKIAIQEPVKKIKELKSKKGKRVKVSIKRTSGFQKFYLLNKDFILYQELKALIIKSQLLLEEFLIKKLKRIGKVYYLVLSGFFTGVSSKTDLLLVGRINKKRLKHLIMNLEKDLSREINYTVMALPEFKYRSDLTDRFLFNILEDKKVVLIDELPRNFL